MYICMDLHAVTLCECCYLDGIDRKYRAIALKIYWTHVCVCVCVCVCLYCKRENQNYRVFLVLVCGQL